MKNCFIFSGQGSHRPGMSLNLYNTFQIAKDRIELSNKILGYDISEIMFSAEENVLRQTQYAQPAIFIHSTIIFDLIKDQKECVAVAGHSLGEFSALYANNFFDFETGLQIVDVRARAMHECELNNPGKMSAVIGVSINKIQTICDSVDCQIANINSDTQIVISGSEESIDLASESGGNCECSTAGESNNVNGVTVVGVKNITSTISQDASSLFSKNILNFLDLLIDSETKELSIDWEDEIVKGILVTKNKEITNEEFI